MSLGRFPLTGLLASDEPGRVSDRKWLFVANCGRKRLVMVLTMSCNALPPLSLWDPVGLAPKMQPTRDFSVLFWNNCTHAGRVNELKLTLGLYFKGGLFAGIKKGWTMRNIALGLLMAKRLNPFELFGGHRCKDR